MTMIIFSEWKEMLNYILTRNILLSKSLNHNLVNCQKMSDFSKGLIQLPPKKVRGGKTKLLFVVGSGSLIGAYTASCMVSVLESFEFYPDVADPDDY